MKSFMEEYGKTIIVAIVVVGLILVATLFATDGKASILDVWRNFSLKAGFPNYQMLEAPTVVNAGETATFKSEAEFSKFVEVQIDGQTVDSASYTAAESPTVITLTGEYTGVLDAGRHTLDVISNDGFARAEFTVKAYGITFTDGKQLSWDQIIAGVDSDKYGYDPSKITKNATMLRINSYAFKANENVAEVSFPSNAVVEGYVFEKCPNLKAISVPQSCDLADCAFYDCTNLKTIEFWKNNNNQFTIQLSRNTFFNTGIEKLYLPYYIYLFNYGTFGRNKNLKEIEFENGYTKIGDNCTFDSCTSLEKVILPTSVRSISKGTFYNCASLSSIVYKGTIEQWNTITKGNSWRQGVPSTCVVKCTDGDIAIDNAG